MAMSIGSAKSRSIRSLARRSARSEVMSASDGIVSSIQAARLTQAPAVLRFGYGKG
jgi:hypothetical protein